MQTMELDQRQAWQQELEDLKANLPAILEADKEKQAALLREEAELRAKIENSPEMRRLKEIRNDIMIYRVGQGGKDLLNALARKGRLEKLLAQPGDNGGH